ncbi:flagellar filament capping protein FliD [Allopusillimonas ginsengisoli]|uniref:flagellar filament capping protein FliD n=1 Tax=Allopusillimonas ginsengisoli TaxID=453575 RepID=UPI0014302275|nr:flagellar filament capping protein FliD [Allopusillimonas ginsengisoli]
MDTNTDATALQTLLAFEKGSAGNLAETAAQQARLDINGIQLESSSNTLHNAIEGVTLTLSSTTATGEPHMLTLARDDAAAHAAIRSFVGAYNNLQGVIKSLTAYNADKQQGGPLTGDGLARRLPERLRQGLHTSVNGATTLTLPELGITSKPDGTLAIDDTRLDKAIKDNLSQVKSLLTGENGFGSRISSIADLYLEPGGELERINATMTTTLKALNKQFEAVSARIDAKMETYRKQFVQLDAMVAQMNSLSNYLTQQLSMLERSAKQK